MTQNDGRTILTLTLAAIAEGLNENYRVAYDLHSETERAFGLAQGIDSALSVFMDMASKAIKDYDVLQGFVDSARRSAGLGDDNLPIGLYL
jgi:hypothetical protein